MYTLPLFLLSACSVRTILFPGTPVKAVDADSAVATDTADTAGSDDTAAPPAPAPLLTVYGPGVNSHAGGVIQAADVDEDGVTELLVGSGLVRPGAASAVVWSIDTTLSGEQTLSLRDPHQVLRGSNPAGAVLVVVPGQDRDGGTGLAYSEPSFKRAVDLFAGDGTSLFPPRRTVGFDEPEPWTIQDVSAVGDPDGDGVDDLGLVAIETQTISTDGSIHLVHRGFLVPVGTTTSSLAWHDDFVHVTDQTLGRLRGVGDFDGDGVDDLMTVGETLALIDGPVAGGELDDVARWQLESPSGGIVAEPAGDMDGDGYPDLVIGQAVGEAGPAGWAWILHGPDSDGATSVGELPTRVNGTYGDYFGAAVAPAGDVDGDGGMDVWVGSIGHGAWLYAEHGGTLEALSHVDPGTDAAGSVLFGGTDVSGDGVPDLLLSDPNAASPTFRGAGVTWLWSGADLPAP